MNFSRLVALDFDGVLHPCLAGTFIYLPDFEAWLRRHPDVGVLFATTWREQYSLQKLAELFSHDLRARIVGATPVFAEGPGCRYEEILSWIRSTGFRGPWAALDDDLTLFPDNCDELVLCATVRGLRRAQLDELTRKLQLSI